MRQNCRRFGPDATSRVGLDRAGSACSDSSRSCVSSAVLFRVSCSLPPSTFKAGLPSDYVIRRVSEKYLREYRTWIIRTNAGFYAILPSVHPSWMHDEVAQDGAEI